MSLNIKIQTGWTPSPPGSWSKPQIEVEVNGITYKVASGGQSQKTHNQASTPKIALLVKNIPTSMTVRDFKEKLRRKWKQTVHFGAVRRHAAVIHVPHFNQNEALMNDLANGFVKIEDDTLQISIHHGNINKNTTDAQRSTSRSQSIKLKPNDLRNEIRRGRKKSGTNDLRYEIQQQKERKNQETLIRDLLKRCRTGKQEREDGSNGGNQLDNNEQPGIIDEVEELHDENINVE